MFKKSKKEDEELQMQAKAGLDDMGDFDSLDELEAIAAPSGKKKKLPPWAIIPVSYTHLDVYKRQASERNNQENRKWRKITWLVLQV